MPHISLASLEDARLDVYRDLPRANLTAVSRRFIVEGKWMVERLVASGFAVDSIVVEERQTALLPSDLPSDVPVYVLPAALIETLIGFNFHRGILACGLRQAAPSWRELIPSAARATFVACVDIHDPTNLGGILRNCAAFGVDGVLLSRRCADPFSRRVLRVSMGTAFKLKIATCSDLLADLVSLREASGCELIATVLSDDAERLDQAPRGERLTLLIGNEGHGLPTEFVASCDRRVTLPMAAGIDSLNAAAATAVFLFHFTR